MKNPDQKTAEIRTLRPDLTGTALNTPPAPENLTKAAAAWWQKLVAEYDLSDPAGLLLLQAALECFDRVKACQRAVKREGMTFRDKAGQPKPHPLLTTERDSRAAMLANLKALNLDIEPLRDHAGRPPGR